MERETREPQGGESNWYYLRDDETIGPLPAAELRRLFRAGKLGSETLVWRAGMKDWVPASSLGVTATATPAPPPPPGKRATPVASPQAELPESEADRRNAGRIAKSRRHAKKKRLQVLAVAVLAVIAIVLSGVAVIVLWPPSNGDSTTTAESNGAAISSAPQAAAKSSGADVGSKRTPPRSDATPRDRDEDRRAEDTSPPEATPRDPADRDLDDREMLATEEMFRRDPPASDRSSDDLEPPVAEPTGMGPGGIGPSGGVKRPVASGSSAAGPPAASPPAAGLPAAGLPPVDAPALLYQRVEVLHDPSYEILGQNFADKSRYQILSKLELRPRAADGSREVSQVIEQTRLELAGDTTRELYESALRDLIGQQYTFTLNSRDEVIKFTGFGGKTTSAPVTRSGMEGFASVTVIDQDGWKEIAQLSFLQPDRSIAAGQPWTRPMSHDFNELGSWQGTTTFTLQGPEGAGTRYNYVHDMTYTPPKGGPGLLPFDISDVDFKATKAEGSFVFDPTHGHVTDVRETFEMEGSLGASVLAGSATVKLREHQELTIQLSRQNPWTSSASTPSPLPTPTPAR